MKMLIPILLLFGCATPPKNPKSTFKCTNPIANAHADEQLESWLLMQKPMIHGSIGPSKETILTKKMQLCGKY